MRRSRPPRARAMIRGSRLLSPGPQIRCGRSETVARPSRIRAEDELLGDRLGLGIGGLESARIGRRLVRAGQIRAVEDDAGRAGVDQPRHAGGPAGVDRRSASPRRSPGDTRAPAPRGRPWPRCGRPCRSPRRRGRRPPRRRRPPGPARRPARPGADVGSCEQAADRQAAPRSSLATAVPRKPPPPVTSTRPRSVSSRSREPPARPRPRASRGRSWSCGGYPPGTTGWNRIVRIRRVWGNSAAALEQFAADSLLLAAGTVAGPARCRSPGSSPRPASTPTRAERKTSGWVLKIASQGMVNRVSSGRTTRCDFRPQNQIRPRSSR